MLWRISWQGTSDENWGMSLAVRDLDPAAGDPHQQLIDAVRAGGPRRLAEELGDRAHELRLLTGLREVLFVPSEPSAEAFADVIGSLQAMRSALDAFETFAVVALADSLTLSRQAEARARAAQEAGEEPPPARLLREASREAAREVSMLTRRSPASASRSLAARRRLVADMPVMLTALADSQVTAEDAYRTSRSFAPLTPGQRREADRLMGGVCRIWAGPGRRSGPTPVPRRSRSRIRTARLADTSTRRRSGT